MVSARCGLRRIGVRRSGVALLHHPGREIADPIDGMVDTTLIDQETVYPLDRSRGFAGPAGRSRAMLPR